MPNNPRLAMASGTVMNPFKILQHMLNGEPTWIPSTAAAPTGGSARQAIIARLTHCMCGLRNLPKPASSMMRIIHAYCGGRSESGGSKKSPVSATTFRRRMLRAARFSMMPTDNQKLWSSMSSKTSPSPKSLLGQELSTMVHQAASHLDCKNISLASHCCGKLAAL